MENIYTLTQKQKKAFDNLKKAYSDCIKSGLSFVNNNTVITVYSSEYVSGSTDIREEGDIPNEMCDMNKFVAPIDQWIDCEVYLILTDKGKELLNIE